MFFPLRFRRNRRYKARVDDGTKFTVGRKTSFDAMVGITNDGEVEGLRYNWNFPKLVKISGIHNWRLQASHFRRKRFGLSSFIEASKAIPTGVYGAALGILDSHLRRNVRMNI